MAYPIEIAPSNNFIPKIDLPKLCKDNNLLMIMRQVKKSMQDCLRDSHNGQKILSPTLFSQDDVANLSTNLLGALFTHLHYNIRCCSDKSNAKWQGEDMDKIHLDDNDFMNINPSPTYLGFYVKDLHNLQIPYQQRVKDLETWQDMAQKAKSIAEERELKCTVSLLSQFLNKDTNVEAIGYLTVSHDPTVGNYWHTVVDCHCANMHESVPPNSKPNNGRHLMRSMREKLVFYAHLLPFNFASISPATYQMPC